MQETVPIRITGKITATDYVRAQWLHLRPSKAVIVMGLLLLFVMIAVWVFHFVMWVRGEMTGLDTLPIPALTILVLLYCVFMNWHYKRAYRKHKMIQQSFDITISEETLHTTTEFGESHLPWNFLLKFKDNKHLFLVYPSTGTFFPLPKHLFAGPEEINRCRELLSRNVK